MTSIKLPVLKQHMKVYILDVFDETKVVKVKITKIEGGKIHYRHLDLEGTGEASESEFKKGMIEALKIKVESSNNAGVEIVGCVSHGEPIETSTGLTKDEKIKALEAELKFTKEELEAEKKLVNYYAENGFSFAKKRVKERREYTA